MGFWCESQRKRDHYEGLDVGGTLEKWDEVECTGLMWLTKAARGGLF
jgi:hypothetical protein